MLVRDHVRWPVFILVAGLLVALTPFFQRGGALIPRMIPFAPASDGPTAVTDSQGRFRFAGLHNASHLLRLDPQSLPAGIQSASADLVMTLSPGVTRALTVAPGLVLRATYHAGGTVLDGVLFQDQDGDRQQSRGEPGLRGARVIDPDIFQYYVPFNDNNLQQSFADQLDPRCLTGRIASPTIASTISLTGSANNTIVYYDHWEDGYDADPIVPAPGSTTEVFTVNAGKVKTWPDDVPTPRTGTPLLHDGRDRITVVGQPVSAVRAAWLKPVNSTSNQEPGTRLAGAWEMPKVSDWGQHYVIPVGEDLVSTVGTTDFDYVSVSLMAAYDNTVVTFVADPTNPGPTTTTYTLNAGQTAYVRGSANRPPISIHSGARADSTLPVQVQVRAGTCRAAYSGRSYSLVPVDRWTNDYWSPVASFFKGQNGCRVHYQPLPQPQQPNDSADVDIYIFNPDPVNPLRVNYEAPPPSPPLPYSIGVITIPAHSTGSYLNLRFPGGIPAGSNLRSNTQGVHLFSNNLNAKFWAVAVADSTSLGNDGADFDWSYALIPAKDLSSRVVLSWSPGSYPPPAPLPGRLNGSVVFVQAVRDSTIVTVDLDGNGVPDTFDTDGNGVVQNPSAYGYDEINSNNGITLRRGQMLRIGNPINHDMAGAIISTQDVRHPLAAVYGEDACVADFGAPYLDLGYTVLPLPTPTIDKTSRLLIDADHSGDISPGDTLEYKIQVYNSGTGPILDPQIIDTLPYTYTDFIVGSLRSDPTPAAPGVSYDDGSGTFSYIPTAPQNTPDPRIHALKAPYLIINPGDGVVVTLRIILDRQIPRNVLAVINYAELRSSNTPPIKVPNRTPLNQVDLVVCKTDGRTSVQPGDQLTYTLTYTNAGPGIAYNAVITDTLPTSPTTVLNVSTSPAVPGVITPTIALPHVYFQLGTLPAGRSGSATISLTLGPTPKGQDVVNTVDIGTRSHEINLANNHCEDIDKVPGTTAVVLSDFQAERAAEGVLVRWSTIAEQDNYGFRLYRGTTLNRAGAALITPAIIPGQGRGRSDGASYSFFDADAPAGPLYYWLEDIDLFGVSTFHGPAQPTIQGAQHRVFLPIVMGGP